MLSVVIRHCFVEDSGWRIRTAYAVISGALLLRRRRMHEPTRQLVAWWLSVEGVLRLSVVIRRCFVEGRVAKNRYQSLLLRRRQTVLPSRRQFRYQRCCFVEGRGSLAIIDGLGLSQIFRELSG